MIELASNVEVMKKMFPKCPICGWDKKLLNKKYPFKFWKELKKKERRIIEPKIKEKIFAPMDYMGGHTDYRKRAIGYIILTPDSLAYKTSKGSLNKMNMRCRL